MSAPADTGEWNNQVWVAAVRYERRGRIGVRIDGGLIPSPVGYANMLLRPHLNTCLECRARLKSLRAARHAGDRAPRPE